MPEPSVETQLAVISTKLDVLIATRDDHELRIRKIEQFKWVLLGFAAAVSGASSAVFTTLAK